MKTDLAAQAGKTALPAQNYRPLPTQRSLPNRSSFPCLITKPKAARLINSSSTTIQASGCWKWLTSCFTSKAKVRVEAEEQELIQRPVVVVVEPRKPNVTVSMDDYTRLEEGGTYTPTHLTNCAMVFAIGEGGGCVYHWPFHTWTHKYITKLETAMSEFDVTRPVRYYIFGMDASSPMTAEQEEKSWREFGVQFASQFKTKPQMFLVKEPITMPPLKYSGGDVTTFVSHRALKLD